MPNCLRGYNAGTWTQERRNSSSFILIDMSYYGNCLPTKGILNIESLSYVDINFGSSRMPFSPGSPPSKSVTACSLGSTEVITALG
jgi:hypothetical protein